MKVGNGTLLAAALGGALVYFLDPERGHTRRAQGSAGLRAEAERLWRTISEPSQGTAGKPHVESAASGVTRHGGA